MLKRCSGPNCGMLPISAFYPGSIRAREARCKRCNNRARGKRRRVDPVSRLQWKIYQYERKHKASHPYPSRESVEALLRRYNIVAEPDSELCAVRYFDNLPISECPWNAVVMSTQDARTLPRNTEARLASFPPQLQQEMNEFLAAM